MNVAASKTMQVIDWINFGYRLTDPDQHIDQSADANIEAIATSGTWFLSNGNRINHCPIPLV